MILTIGLKLILIAASSNQNPAVCAGVIEAAFFSLSSGSAGMSVPDIGKIEHPGVKAFIIRYQHRNPLSEKKCAEFDPVSKKGCLKKSGR